ncbi:Vacuolar cation/proton exchanger 2 [Nymphaea thermarum]|nr:Vacuolar cation/proton exchanger 2 [Nymphaea thermarum]
MTRTCYLLSLSESGAPSRKLHGQIVNFDVARIAAPLPSLMSSVEEHPSCEEGDPIVSPSRSRKPHSSSVPDFTLWTAKQIRYTIWTSVYTVLIKAKINVLLPFGPLAILLHYLTGRHATCLLHWAYSRRPHLQSFALTVLSPSGDLRGFSATGGLSSNIQRHSSTLFQR